MLRVFSSIRKNLLAENKLVRYLTYAVGEVLLIMVGIFLALQLNNWNEERKDRSEEQRIISRFLEDLNNDLADFDLSMSSWRVKNDSLNRLRNNFSENKISSPLPFLNDIILSTHNSWSQRPPNRTTFDDMIGSGKLGLIDKSEIRDLISDYYTYYTMQLERIYGRKTKYADLTYQFVPRRTGSEASAERELESNLSDTDVAELAAQVLNSPVRDHVIAEINFGRFGYGVTSRIHQRAKELKESLLEYQNQIKN